MNIKIQFIQLLFLFSIATISNYLRAQAVPNVETPYLKGEVIIQLKDGYSINELLNSLPSTLNVKAIKEISPRMRYWELSFDTTLISNADFLSLMKESKATSMSQNNHFVYERNTPDDVSFSSQWHHLNTGSTGGTVDADIDSELAWDITTGGVTASGDTIVVCLVEGGGANYNHPDLIDNFWRNYNEIDGNSIDDDGNGYIDDFNGWNVGSLNDNHSTGSHGTQCYGMIGAKGNNTTGVTGINWNVKVMLVSGFGVTESSVISAYDYPLTMRKLYNQTGGASGAFVVATSSSWGIDNANPSAYPLWCAFYDSLGVHGVLSVAATTNNNANVDVVGDMPTACSSQYLISVTRTDQNDNRAGGYGLTTIDYGAPGINVYTTTGTNTYTSVTGTSFSCPLTAGVIALMYSVQCNELMGLVNSDPQAGADYISQTLANATDPTPAMSGMSVTGGRLNAYNAVNYISTNCLLINAVEHYENISANISVFPNPFSNSLTVDLSGISFRGNEEFQLKIYNSFGEEILWKDLNSQANSISVEHFIPGIYFYKLTDRTQGVLINGTLIKD